MFEHLKEESLADRRGPKEQRSAKVSADAYQSVLVKCDLLAGRRDEASSFVMTGSYLWRPSLHPLTPKTTDTLFTKRAEPFAKKRRCRDTGDRRVPIQAAQRSHTCWPVQRRTAFVHNAERVSR